MGEIDTAYADMWKTDLGGVLVKQNVSHSTAKALFAYAFLKGLEEAGRIEENLRASEVNAAVGFTEEHKSLAEAFRAGVPVFEDDSPHVLFNEGLDHE